jgi:arylsulfatase A-like enzyme
MTLQRWLLVNAFALLVFFVLAVAVFCVLAGRLDNALATAAFQHYPGTIALAHLALVPGYAIIWLLHSLVTFAPARRLWQWRLAEGHRPPSHRRLLLSALLWNLLVTALSLGPMTYVTPGSLDSIARLAAALSPSINLYYFKYLHLQELFTVLLAVFALIGLSELMDWWNGIVQTGSPAKRMVLGIGASLVIGAHTVWLLNTNGQLQYLKAPKPHILLIASDSLRYDHLGCHHYPRDTSPNIDRLVQQSIDFQGMYVATASTIESWASFLTGNYPANHGIRYMFISKDQAAALEAQEYTLPKVLGRAGYYSVVVGDWVADCFKKIDFGFDKTLTSDVQNLDVFLAEVAFKTHFLIPHYFGNGLGEKLIPNMRQVTSYMNPARLVSTFLEEFDTAAVRGQPFFGLLFLSSTHLPFMSAHPFNVQYSDPNYRGANRFRLSFDVDDFMQRGFADAHDPAEKQQVIDLYDGGVCQFDHYVGRIVDYLADTGLDESTLLVILSDHGEDLYDPGTTLGHGHNFNGGDQGNRIPFIMRLPQGRLAATKVTQIVRNIDVMPTLLELIDYRGQIQGIDGQSLVASFGDPPQDLRLVAFAETCYLFFPKKIPGEQVYVTEPADRTLFIDADFNNQFVLKPEYHDYVIQTKDRMMRTTRWKLLYTKGKNGPIYRFYDMENDPYQQHNLARAGGAVFEQMKAQLRTWMAADN